MLEHLRVGPLKRSKSPGDIDATGDAGASSGAQQKKPSDQATNESLDAATAFQFKDNGSISRGGDDVDNKRISVVINETRKRSLKDMPNGVSTLIDSERKLDPRKRYSISNGDMRGDGKSRELSPSTRSIQQRKLSADMRIRGNVSQFSDDYLLRRPIRLKNLASTTEAHDTLHVQAIDVSNFWYFFFIL